MRNRFPLWTETVSNYSVSSFRTAEELDRSFEHFVPDLILMDIELPQKSGRELIRDLKSDTRYENIPIIVISSVTDPNSIEEAFTHGASTLVNKPYDIEEMINTVKETFLFIEKAHVPGYRKLH